MAKAQLDPIRPEAEDFFVIDTDFHLDVAVDDLMAYMENEAARERMEHIGGLPTTAGMHWDNNIASNSDDVAHVLGAATTEDDIREAMEEFSIDMPILTPQLSNLPGIHSSTIRSALCQAYNDYVLDNIADLDDNLPAVAALPQPDCDAMAEELDRIGSESDFVGAYCWYGAFKPLGSTDYDPVYEKLVSLDLPLVVHGSTQYWPKNDLIGDHIETAVELRELGWPIHAMVHVANMIMSGTFDKFPDLDVVVLEAGTKWLPFLLGMDHMYHDLPEDIRLTKRKQELGEEYLNRLPSEYLFENFTFGTHPMIPMENSRHEAAILEMCRAESTFAFSSDWPHVTFDTPNWLFEQNALDDDARRNIFRENAEDVYRL